ncbi:MAG: hypothetical protein Q4G35_06380 [Propionibacteriaceae bacterium]|nr:hypothetical protein [Propionibacteriaceae bacterium]
MRRLAIVVASAVIALAGVLVPTPASAQVDVYTTPGEHKVNGRQWKTTCQPYSSTVERCRTEIMAVTVVQQGGRYVEKRMWTFNNLTYKPSPRSTWAFMNPLVTPGDHIIDGRKWRTECDTDWTGRGGCRSQIMATVIEKNPKGGYQSVDKYVFNNIVHVTPVPCPVSQDQMRRDTKIPTTVTAGCTRSASNDTWAALDLPVVLPDGYRFMSTAFYRLSGSTWQYRGRSGPNWQICAWARDNSVPQDLIKQHLSFCSR